VGLDMYLQARKYINVYDYNASEQQNQLVISPKWKEIIAAADMTDIAAEETGVSVEVNVAYWRKNNAVHKWFVDNLNNGEDDCQEYYVSRGHLQELRNLCKQAINTKDANLLPTASGFFFGSTDTDEYYWDKIKDTVKKLDRVLSLPENLRFYYQASW
jgi:hypothetical protein